MTTAAPFLLLSASAAPPSGSSLSLVVRGQFFALADGTYWTSIQTSDFSLPALYLDGHDVRPILDERRALGFNDLRQWILNASVVGQVSPGGIYPAKYPNFYDRLRALWELCGSYGFAIEVTAFTSCIPLMPNVDDQVKHWQRTQDAARGLAHVRLELVNEYNWGHGENAPDRSLWSMRPSGIIASSGSSTADAPPSEPVWDYCLYHSNGLDQWQRKVGHNAMEWGNEYRIPALSNENTRYPDDDSSDTHAYDAAAGAALLCAGACFHSQAGKYSRPFDAVEKRCAEAWVAGARSVPLRFQDGYYTHETDRENAQIVRSYSRTLASGEKHYIDIRY